METSSVSLRHMTLDLSLLAHRYRGRLVAVGVVSTLGWAAYSATTGARELIEKRQQIRELEEKNTDLKNENQKKQERIKRLSDPASIDLEIRKTDKLKPNERMYVLPKAAQGK
jgi:cell division protein FtsB